LDFDKDDKGQDYHMFYEFITSWAYDMNLLNQINAQSNEFELIETYDNVDEAINSMTEYPEAVSMLESIGIKT